MIDALELDDQPTTATADPLLYSLQASVLALRRLNDLELAGRTMMTFMRGHMAEVGHLVSIREYLDEFYSDHAKEYVQRDEFDFVVHHCLRTLFSHWREEMDRLRAGPLGDALDTIDASLPSLSTPTRDGRTSIAPEWYDEIRPDIERGHLPPRRGSGNPVMSPEACAFQDRPDLMRGQFVIWCGETWARQLPPVWELVRETIATNRYVEERFDERAVDTRVKDAERAYRATVDALSTLYRRWHEFHVATVDVHDPMYEQNVEPLQAWIRSFAPDLETWEIKEDTKYEMYVEVATTVEALKGNAVDIEMPDFRYWRRVPWTPTCIRPDAPGMPPFRTVQPSLDLVAAGPVSWAAPDESARSPLDDAGPPEQD